MKVSLVHLKVCSFAYQAQQMLVNYFDSKCDGDKCRLFISLLKSRSMTVVRKKLRIKMINSSKPSSYVVRSLVDAFSNIGKKYRSKDCNAAHRVLSQSIMNKSTKALRLLKPTSKLFNLDVKKFYRYYVIEYNNLNMVKQMSGPSLAGFHAVI